MQHVAVVIRLMIGCDARHKNQSDGPRVWQPNTNLQHALGQITSRRGKEAIVSRGRKVREMPPHFPRYAPISFDSRLNTTLSIQTEPMPRGLKPI